MESKLKPRDFLTLLLALLLGGGVAAFSQRDEVGASSESPSATASASAHPNSSPASASSHASRGSPEAVACASAWESLKDGRLKRSDRIEVQLKLLAEWSRHDLAAALLAFYAEREESFYNGISFVEEHLLPAMAAEPELVEDLLKSGRLGVNTPQMRSEWFEQLGKADPVGVLDRLDELPAARREDVLVSAIGSLPSIREDPATWQAGMDRLSPILAARPRTKEFSWIEPTLGFHKSYQDLNAAYLATEDPRLQHLFVAAAEHAMNENDPFGEGTDDSLEMQNLPEPLRSAVLAKRKEAPAEEPLPPDE